MIVLLLLGPLAGRGESGFGFSEFREKVIYYDPAYDFLGPPHLSNGEALAQFFIARGFVAKDAVACAAWMQAQVRQNTAYGTVCLIGMGVAPATVLWEGAGAKLTKTRLIEKHIAEKKPSLLRQYMEAGGRVVWPSIGMVYAYQGAEGSIAEIPRFSGQAWLADIRFHPAFWGHELSQARGMFNAGPTAEGKQWGLTGQYVMQLAVLSESVTTALSADPEFKVTNLFLKTLNGKYPGSGLIGLPTYTDGKNRGQMEDFYRVALYAGAPVSVPVVKEAPEEKDQEAYRVGVEIRDARNRCRTAFVRKETMTARLEIANASGKDLVGTAAIRISDRQNTVLFQKDQPVQVTSGNNLNLETTWPLKDAAVGDYLVAASVAGQGTAGPLAEGRSSFCVRPQPRSEGVVLAPQCGVVPRNPARRARQIREMAEAKLGLMVNHYDNDLANALLAAGIPIVFRLESAMGAAQPGDLPQLGARGESYPGNPPDVACPPAIARIGKQMAGLVADYAGLPNNLPYGAGFDDWGFVGWNWAPAVKAEFKKLTGLSAPIPIEINRSHPRYMSHDAFSIKFPKGLVDPRNVWLQWNAFSADRLGRAFGEYASAMRRTYPEIWVGKLTSSPWHFMTNAMDPPKIFGNERLPLVSYYLYWDNLEPQFNHVYWMELLRMGNRDLPLLLMTDIYLPFSGELPSYTRAGLFAGWCGGARIHSHFIYSDAQPEARAELWRLSKQLDPCAKLFGSLKPVPKPVGLLVPATAACFDGDYPLHTSNVFNNLLCAKIDVEPVAEEELLGDGASPARYRAIILSDVDWLRRDVAEKLEKYITGGGTVLLDRMTEVPIAGAKRLAIDLVFGAKEPATDLQRKYGTPQWDIMATGLPSCRLFSGKMDKPYGDPAVLAALREALYPHAEPRIQSAADNLIVRRFETHGAEYLWLMNVETKAEHDMLRRSSCYGGPSVEFEAVTKYLAEVNIEGIFKASLTLPPGNHVIYDVLKGTKLRTSPKDGRAMVAVEMQRFGGTLLALLDKEIAGIAVRGPKTLRKGEGSDYAIEVTGPRTGAIPVQVKVASPRGEEAEYSQTCLTINGAGQFTITPANNDATGIWRIELKDLLSGKRAAMQTKL